MILRVDVSRKYLSLPIINVMTVICTVLIMGPVRISFTYKTLPRGLVSNHKLGVESDFADCIVYEGWFVWPCVPTTLSGLSKSIKKYLNASNPFDVSSDSFGPASRGTIKTIDPKATSRRRTKKFQKLFPSALAVRVSGVVIKHVRV